MKKRVLAIVFGMMTFSACQTKQEYLTKEQLLQKSDSLTEIRFRQLKKQAEEDLQFRMAIEVKPKVDSILGQTTPVVSSPAEENISSMSDSARLRPSVKDIIMRRMEDAKRADSSKENES